MQALTIDNIHRVHDQLPVRLELDDTTTAYIQAILTPYAQAIQQVTDLDRWFPQVFTGMFVEQSHYWINHGPQKLKIPTADALTNARKAVIDFLIDSTLFLATEKAEAAGSDVVLPWDVQAAIAADVDSRTVFGITGTQLPVTVRIGGRDHEHAMSQEFVAGLMDYFRARGQTVQVYMFGVPLGFHGFELRHDHSNALPYHVTWIPGNKDRVFATPDYLTGASTAALWLGEDVHTRVTNLRYFDGTTEHPLTF